MRSESIAILLICAGLTTAVVGVRSSEAVPFRGPDPEPPILTSEDAGTPHRLHVLSPKAALGKKLFFDTSLSSPAGQSCGSCHTPSAGFTFPDSHINETIGVAPGAVAGRFGFRAVPQVGYAKFSPKGVRFVKHFALYIGGQFWDGRADDLLGQAQMPFVGANEMNNMTHNIGDPSLVVQKVASGSHAAEFKKVFGPDVFSKPTEVVFRNIADAISKYEESEEVSPFSSKYDAWVAGKAEFTEEELLGLRMFSGTWSGRLDGAPFPINVHCIDCHANASIPSAQPDLFTMICYQNMGVPKNPNNPFYKQTDSVGNPAGYNPDGDAFIDYGLGGMMYPQMGLPKANIGPGSNGLGDFLGINGAFKAPSLRNVDMRPYPGFVKAYFHNGVFKSLEQVVHFYNTRNLTTQPGEVINFEDPQPYANLVGTPLWGEPEYPSPETMVNAPGDPVSAPVDPGKEASAIIGNLEMSPEQEAAMVAFLKTLTDGYFDPTKPDDVCIQVTAQPKYQRVGRRGTAQFAVAASNPEPLMYQWRRNGVPIPGEKTSYIRVSIAEARDAGEYDCVITGPCGSVTSMKAGLDVCLADIDLNGGVEDADFFAFLDAFATEQAPADLNEDGEYDLSDFFLFLSAFDQGC